MLLTQIKQTMTNQILNAPRSPSALEVAVLGPVLEPRTPIANLLPTDWRLEGCQLQLVEVREKWFHMVEEKVQEETVRNIRGVLTLNQWYPTKPATVTSPVTRAMKQI